MKKQKGFTLVEMLVVIAIIALLFGIGVPTYMLVTRNVKQRSYENKVSYALSKAEAWASDTGRTVVNIKHLIEEGYMEADNENGDYDNPVDDTSMLCYTIRIDYLNNQYTGTLTDERYCNYDELEKQTSIIEIVKMDDAGNVIPEDSWSRSDNVLQVKFKKDSDLNLYQNSIQSIEWKGNSNVDTVLIHNDFSTKNQYNVRAAQIMNTKYEATMTIVHEGRTYIYKAYTQVKIDRQNPIIYRDEVAIEDFDKWTDNAKKVHVISSDFDGSGVYGYYLNSNNNSCSSNKSDYKTTSSLAFDLDLNEGKHYICVMDNVGNISDSTVINIVKLDSTPPTIDFQIDSSSKMGVENWYRSLAINVLVHDEESGPNAIRYCITTGSSCDPNSTLKINPQNGMAKVSYTTANQRSQKVCAIGIDNAGNQSPIKCTDGYLFDNTSPSINKLTTSKENHEYSVNYGANDAESGLYQYQLYIGQKNNKTINYNLINTNKTSDMKGSDVLSNLKANEKYYVKLQVTNKSGLIASKEISFDALFTLDDAAYYCDIQKGYCDKGIYVRYSGYLFALYRKTTKSVFGVNVDANMKGSIITGTCCDSGTCTAPHVYTTALRQFSGIYGDGSYKQWRDDKIYSGESTLTTRYYNNFNKPGSYLNLETYTFGKIENSPDKNGYVDWQITSLNIKNAKFSKLNPATISARYGLLDFNEYKGIRNKSYMKGIGTLLSTIYPHCYITDKAIYENPYDHNDGPWHHLCNTEPDTIMGIFAQGDILTFVPAVAQVLYDNTTSRTAALTVPFKIELRITGGSGTKDDPYTIE